MNKFLIISILMFSSCATRRTENMKNAADQVAGLETMCKKSGPAMKARQEDKSLYVRLGKRNGIKNLFTQLLPAHRANKKIAHFFKYSEDDIVIAHLTDFLVAGSGGPNKYKGRSMKNVHARLNITNADFLEAGGDVKRTMKQIGYGGNEIQEVVCALVHFIPQVVTQ